MNLPLPVDRGRRNWGPQWEPVKDKGGEEAQTVAGPSARHGILDDTSPDGRPYAVIMLDSFLNGVPYFHFALGPTKDVACPSRQAPCC